MHDQQLVAMVNLAVSFLRSFSSVMVVNLSLLYVTGVPFAHHMMA